jgi:hypothetical protein
MNAPVVDASALQPPDPVPVHSWIGVRVTLEAITRRARKSERNAWEVDDLTVPVAGSWQAKVAILIDDFEQATLEGTIAIRP